MTIQLPLRLSKPASMMATTTFIAALALTSMTSADAKQSCSTSAGKDGYWSWRMIDGRKCWYEGKPMLSKAALEWSKEATAKAAPDEDVAASAPPARRSNPMDAQARDTDGDTFEALWQQRIEQKR